MNRSYTFNVAWHCARHVSGAEMSDAQVNYVERTAALIVKAKLGRSTDIRIRCGVHEETRRSKYPHGEKVTWMEYDAAHYTAEYESSKDTWVTFHYYVDVLIRAQRLRKHEFAKGEDNPYFYPPGESEAKAYVGPTTTIVLTD